MVIQVYLGSNPFLDGEVLRGMGDAALRRAGWTIHTAPGASLRPRDLVSGGADAVVLLSVEELAVNELRESFHHWVRTISFPVRKGTLGSLRNMAGAVQAPRQVGDKARAVSPL